MNVSLTPRLEALIRAKLDSGRYNDTSEVVREALGLLEAQDQRESWLREQIAIADAQIASGDVVEATEAFWTDLDREVDRRELNGDHPAAHAYS